MCLPSLSGALRSLGLGRREALWSVEGLAAEVAAPLPLPTLDETPSMAGLSDLETIRWDYRTMAHSAAGHPLAPLRETLHAQGLPDARTVHGLGDGRFCRYAGMVICRQRPGTASGVTFMTLEDETGFVNVVLWRQVFDRYRVLAKTEPFLGISGRLQAEQGVVHLVARHLWVPEVRYRPARARSRDFH